MKPAYPRPIRRSSRLKPETFDHNGLGCAVLMASMSFS
jgi:hypothetical protein